MTAPTEQPARRSHSENKIPRRCTAVLYLSSSLLLYLTVGSGTQKFAEYDWEQSMRVATLVVCGYALLLVLGRQLAKTSPAIRGWALAVSVSIGIAGVAIYARYGAEVWFGGKPVIRVLESNGGYYSYGGREMSEQEYLENKARSTAMSVTSFGIILSALTAVSSLCLVGHDRRRPSALKPPEPAARA